VPFIDCTIFNSRGALVEKSGLIIIPHPPLTLTQYKKDFSYIPIDILFTVAAALSDAFIPGCCDTQYLLAMRLLYN
jgi:hypothetical protein